MQPRMMNGRRRVAALMLGLIVTLLISGLPLVPGSTATVAAQEPPAQPAEQQQLPEQVRAFWVPMHADGLKTRAQVDELIANVQRANANTIIAQMRRHGDSMYNNSLEPRAVWAGMEPAEVFDPLRYLLDQAHARGIRVHAWLVASVVCRPSDPLWNDPRHMCTAHGPNAGGADRWTTETYGGTQVGDVDFGHPAAQIQLENVVQYLIQNYPDVDGIHLDYIRYGDQEYGYNAVSLDRFRAFYGLPANYRPAPADPLWSQWRRDQVTEQVRRIYMRSKALKPTIEISVAAIAWGGAGNRDRADFVNSAAYSRVFQDWQGWLEEGIIDVAYPMFYFQEGVGRSRAWYDGWINFGRGHQGKRAIIPGTGAWLNSDRQGIAQLQRALAPDAEGRTYQGAILYAYNEPIAGSTFERRRTFMDQLRENVFSSPARPVDWPWVFNNQYGHLQGIARLGDRLLSDSTTNVGLVKDGQWLGHIRTGYDGYYAVVDLEPGVYNILIEDTTTGESAWYEVLIEAGKVTSGP